MRLPAGPQLDLPHDVTPKQLETLLNGLLKQEEKLPYSFFVNEQQLSQELGSHLLQHKVSRLHSLYTPCSCLKTTDTLSGTCAAQPSPQPPGNLISGLQ